jgi:predicted TIM-barrel fold metal-dependent hydrolase
MSERFILRQPRGISRRETLKALAAAGSMGLVFGQKANQATAKGGRIDVHHHHAPPGMGPGPGIANNRATQRWTPEFSLQMMDKFDIAVAILSMSQMGDILYDGTEKGRAAVRQGNEYAAKVMADHPKRFGMFAGVPLPDIDGVLKEIEYGLDTLKADGIGIYTNDNHNRWPGDPYFEPMWQELNRRSAVVYVHPLAPSCCVKLNDGAPVQMNEYEFDITRACTSLLLNGVLHNYPNVRIIIPHSGGAMPAIAGRIQNRFPHDPKRDTFIPNGVIPELQKFYVDVSHGTFPFPMAALLKFAHPDRILFGTDFSAEPIESTVNEIPHLGLPAQLLKAIERGNAEKLFPRFKVA